MAPKLEPMSHFLGQLDTSEYDSRGAILKAARALRASRKRFLDAVAQDERDFRNRQLSIYEKRALVRQGTHKWCKGLGGCRGRGYLTGKDGALLKHGPCKGDGLIRVKGGGKRKRRPSGFSPFSPAGPRPRGRGRTKGPTRKRRSRGRGRSRIRNAAVGATAIYFAGGQMFGTIGYIGAVVVLSVMLVLAVLGGVARAVAK